VTLVYLSIGSNIDAENHIRQCAIDLAVAFTDCVWSPVYRSAAVGMTGDDFLNAVVQTRTKLAVNELLDKLTEFESAHGRVRSKNKFTSRTLDIDLLLYGDQIINTDRVTIPREEITTAAHVLVPLVDIAGTTLHPTLGLTFAELLEQLKKSNTNTVSKLDDINLDLSNALEGYC